MTNVKRTDRSKFTADSRIIAHNLRVALRHEGITLLELRAIERRHGLTPGRLFIALAAGRLMVSHMLTLMFELGITSEQVFAGTSSSEVSP